MKKVLVVAFIAASAFSSVAPANAQIVSRYQNFSGCRNTALGNNTWDYSSSSQENRAAQAESKKSGGMWSTLGKIGGGIVATVIGSPKAAPLGSQIGEGLGGMLDGGGGGGGGSPATSSQRTQNNIGSRVAMGIDCTDQKKWDSQVQMNQNDNRTKRYDIQQSNQTQRLNIRESNETQRLNIRESNATARYGIDGQVKINQENNVTARYGIDAEVKIQQGNQDVARYEIGARERMNQDNNKTDVSITQINAGVQMRAIDVQERHQNRLRINSAGNNALGWPN